MYAEKCTCPPPPIPLTLKNLTSPESKSLPLNFWNLAAMFYFQVTYFASGVYDYDPLLFIRFLQISISLSEIHLFSLFSGNFFNTVLFVGPAYLAKLKWKYILEYVSDLHFINTPPHYIFVCQTPSIIKTLSIFGIGESQE